MEPYIGIIEGKPGWIQLLEQEGLFYKVYEPGDEPLLLIVDKPSQKAEILAYLREGGAILTDSRMWKELSGEETKKVKIEWITPDGSPFFKDVSVVDIYNNGYLLGKKGFGRINNRFPAIYEIDYKKGECIVVPFDVSPVILDTSRRMKFFYTEKGRYPAETVSSVSKGEVRKLIVNAIRYLFQKRGCYYVHKWYYPEGKRNAFLFRVDTDKSSYKEIDDTYKIAERYGISATFFIDIKGFGKGLDDLKNLKNQEIGVHCYEHRIFSDALKNRKNLSKAKELLSGADVETSGIAAPYGVWNNSLGFVFEELGFLYSSEFAYSYNDLPSYPFINKRFSDMLQIPVHPVSPGTLLYAKNTIPDIKQYFEMLVEERYRKREPIFLYGHSGVISRYPTLFEHIIKSIGEKRDIWQGTFRKFYQWWKMRGDKKFEVSIRNYRLELRGLEKERALFLHIVSPDGKESFIKAKESIDLSKLKWMEMPKVRRFERKRLNVKKKTVKLIFKEMENWLRRR